RAGDRADDVGRQLLGLLLQLGGHRVHAFRPVERQGGTKRRCAGAIRLSRKLPYGGITRIRFEGSVSTGSRRYPRFTAISPRDGCRFQCRVFRDGCAATTGKKSPPARAGGKDNTMGKRLGDAKSERDAPVVDV